MRLRSAGRHRHAPRLGDDGVIAWVRVVASLYRPSASFAELMLKQRTQVPATGEAACSDEPNGSARPFDLYVGDNGGEPAQIDCILRSGSIVARKQLQRDEVTSCATGTMKPGNTSIRTHCSPLLTFGHCGLYAGPTHCP